MVKGVVLAPLLAAFLGASLTGSSTVGGAAFVVTLVFAGLAILGSAKHPR